jgi:hypothetical protein
MGSHYHAWKTYNCRTRRGRLIVGERKTLVRTKEIASLSIFQTSRPQKCAWGWASCNLLTRRDSKMKSGWVSILDEALQAAYRFCTAQPPNAPPTRPGLRTVTFSISSVPPCSRLIPHLSSAEVGSIRDVKCVVIEGRVLAIMDCAFGNAVNRFRESLTKSQREQFAHCQKEDVERTILNIQARHGSQKRLKHMRRISKFIEGMSQLGEVIEVFLNVNNGVAFVWVRPLMPRIGHQTC